MAYVDFFSHPLENSIPSLRLPGALTETGDRAEDFAVFYDSRLQRIRERLADPAIPRPRVFFHVHAVPTGCCATVGGGVFADFIETAGGRNIGAEAVEAVLGNVSLEFLIAADPDFHIATGGRHMAARGGLVLGTGIAPEEARASFDVLVGGAGPRLAAGGGEPPGRRGLASLQRHPRPYRADRASGEDLPPRAFRRYRPAGDAGRDRPPLPAGPCARNLVDRGRALSR